MRLAFIGLFFLCTTIYAKQPAVTPHGVETPGVQTLPYVIDGNVKVFHLIAEPVEKVIYNGKINLLEEFVKKNNRYSGPTMKLPVEIQKIDGWGYNGNIPGPTIIVNQGDFVRFHVSNHLPEPTTVHWHGMIVPNDQDGTGGTADPVIMPGKTAVYEFQIVNEPGTYMYHSGFNDTKQALKGLDGFLLVLPKDGVDLASSDFAIMLQDWAIPEGSEQIKYLSMDRNWFTYNGLAAPNFPVLVVDEGERVRIRFGNLGLMSHPIHLHGYSFKITGTEGGPIQESAQWPAATVVIAPGETRDIEFIANNPGLWRLHCHVLHHILNDTSYFAQHQKNGIFPEGGLWTYLYVKPAKDQMTRASE